MEYELIPIESKVAGKIHILKGTIVDPDNHIIKTVGDVDEWVIKADVDIDDYGIVEDVLVVYHCQSSEKAGVGAFAESEGESDNPLITEGSPFVKDDRVIVLNSGSVDALSADNLKVVGYEDGLPRQCVFQFRITRDDGEIINETLLRAISIDGLGGAHGYRPEEDPDDAVFWTKNGDVWYYNNPAIPCEFSYNTVTQIWTVPFYEDMSAFKGHNKNYWVTFLCEDSIRAQYIPSSKEAPEYEYIISNFRQSEDRSYSKFYEIRVPYYKVISYTNDLVPHEVYPESHCNINKTSNRWLTIKSSIPYTVKFYADDMPSAWFYGQWAVCTHIKCEDCEPYPGDEWYWPPWYGTNMTGWVSVVSSAGDSTNDVWNDPISNELIVTPEAYTVETQIHSMTASYVGPDPCIHTTLCIGGSRDFPIPFEYFCVPFGMKAKPNQ